MFTMLGVRAQPDDGPPPTTRLSMQTDRTRSSQDQLHDRIERLEELSRAAARHLGRSHQLAIDAYTLLDEAHEALNRVYASRLFVERRSVDRGASPSEDDVHPVTSEDEVRREATR
jgi:hypothetical protein